MSPDTLQFFHTVPSLTGEVAKLGEINNALEQTKNDLQNAVAGLESQVEKMGEENAKFEENNKELEAKIGELSVSLQSDPDFPEG